MVGAPGAVHQTKKERANSDKQTQAYYIICSAKVGCIKCINTLLRQGASIHSESMSAWNVWDSAHFAEPSNVTEVLHYIEQAGGRESAKYKEYREAQFYKTIF
jgi:hypothetical protein